MNSSRMNFIRPAAVAGRFYPGDPGELHAMVEGLLAEATSPANRAPKAIIAPHAGYIYSGPVAASAYACLKPVRDAVRRVVLIGPAHFVSFRGIALPEASAFQTPLGRVELDPEAAGRLKALPTVCVSDDPHRMEHSLEVHLPFLQEVLAQFKIVPLLVGQASGTDVQEVLSLLWGGRETLIVVSSDLSHYLDSASARKIDRATADAIERCDPSGVGQDQACGRLPILGLLQLATEKKLKASTLDLRNSGDTGGPRSQVVGYGAFAFFETEAS
jgi:hypothetical protein